MAEYSSGMCFTIFRKEPFGCSETERVLLTSVVQYLSNSLQPHGDSLPGAIVYEILLARILEWEAIPFSRGFSQPGEWIWVSCIVGRFFTIWTISEAQSEVPACGILSTLLISLLHHKHCLHPLTSIHAQSPASWGSRLQLISSENTEACVCVCVCVCDFPVLKWLPERLFLWICSFSFELKQVWE